MLESQSKFWYCFNRWETSRSPTALLTFYAVVFQGRAMSLCSLLSSKMFAFGRGSSPFLCTRHFSEMTFTLLWVKENGKMQNF